MTPELPHRFIASLLSRYRSVLEQRNGQTDSTLVDSYNTLRLADAALDKVTLDNQHPQHPLQLAILGPTQAGKSTLVNLILDARSAGISALAGYTVHAQGFAVNCSAQALLPLEHLMSPLQRVPAQALDSAQLESYALEPVDSGPAALVSTAVVWDSPDFDSIESNGYRGAVLQAAAIADVLILMVSKDKYADKTVWDMLGLLRALGKPLLICINKLDATDEATVVSSFQQRHQTQFNSEAPALVVLPFVRHSGDDASADATVELPQSVRNSLHDALLAASEQADRSRHPAAAQAFIRLHWDTWMAPIHHELAAAASWRCAVDAALIDAETTYADRYLGDPRKYDTFNRALAELLTLLEIPGLAQTLAKTRNLVTWPARKLLGIGRRTLLHETDEQPPDQELDVLELVLEQALTRLQGFIVEQRHEEPEQQHWWQAMHQCLRGSRPDLSNEFEHTTRRYQQDFSPRIDAAAERLYAQLQEQPVLLNSLRAARVTTDAAAVVLAVKSGGLAAVDLVLAPAMLSVTTLLTESALGRYMDTLKRDLMAEQRSQVRKQLLHGVLQRQLLGMIHDVQDGESLMVDADLLGQLESITGLSYER